MKPFLTFFLFFNLISGFAFGQVQDSSAIKQTDSLVSVDTATYVKEIIYRASADSLNVKARNFGSDQLRELKADPDLNYKEPPTIAESLWDRFLAWLRELLGNMIDKAVTTNWGRLLLYALVLVLLIVLIMMVLKVNAFRVLYAAEGGKLKHQIVEENIHEMDFDALIKEAIDKNDFRKGVRLLFLQALKLLSDKQLIHWESGKTNHDYVAELEKKELKVGLNELSFYFDYAWYGNFNITAETFKKAENIFASWRKKVS